MDKTKRYVVRKIDTDDPMFYVVDTTVPSYVLIAPEAVVDKFRDSISAHHRARELNYGM